MNVLDLSENEKYSNKKPIINMTTWMRNQIANFSHAFSAPIAAKQRTSRRTVGHTWNCFFVKSLNEGQYWIWAREIEKQCGERSNTRRWRILKTRGRIDRRLHRINSNTEWKGLERSLEKLCDTWITKSRH